MRAEEWRRWLFDSPSHGEKARYYENHAKKRILDLDLPRQPPEVVKDCKEKRSLQFWCVDRKQVWSRLGDVEAAVKYMYIQNLFTGVPLVSPASVGRSGPLSSSAGSASKCEWLRACVDAVTAVAVFASVPVLALD